MGHSKEHQQQEFKESWREECLKWLCGFANTEGDRTHLASLNQERTL